MATLVERFRTHVRRAGLFRSPGTAIVAVSGGPDSAALLDLLHQAALPGVGLVVAHADHGIQPASAAVAASVERLAARYGLPFELGRLALGPGTSETVARRARYAWLRDVQARRDARYLVTAHHRDDQVETVLLRVLRGSGLAGLAGIPARGRGGLVRPLLVFTRGELAAHVAARALPVHDDPANRDPRNLRSWVRTVVLPALDERLGARARADLERLGRHAARDRRAWDAMLELVPDLRFRLEPPGVSVARGALAHYDDAAAAALVAAAARRVGLVLGPRRASFVARLARRPSGRRLALGRDWSAAVAFDRLRVSRGVAAAAEPVVATGERGRATFGAHVVSWRPEEAPPAVARGGWVTWLAGPGWEVRAPRRGDRLVPLGGVGHRPVRRLLMEARVPQADRATYPVLARGATVLWVPGISRGAAEVPPPGTPAVRVHVTSERAGAAADRRA